MAIAWLLCGRLHALLSTQSLLMAMLHSLIAQQPFGYQWRPLLKTLTSGLGLDDLSFAWPTVVQLLVFIYSVTQQNKPRVLVFIIVMNLIFMFSLWCIDRVGSLYTKQGKGGNDSDKIFHNLQERILPSQRGSYPQSPDHFKYASDWATEASPHPPPPPCPPPPSSWMLLRFYHHFAKGEFLQRELLGM